MKRYIFVAALLSAFYTGSYGQTKDAVVDKFASFPQGADKFFQYIKNEVKYPADAKKDSLTGEVHVEFIVAKSGAIVPESIKIVRGLSASCDAEAIRVIKKAPIWTPASTKTETIDQKITFPVTFVYK